MRALGLTGKDVGDACGVTKEAASNWLKGESMPRPSKLIDLAALLKVPVEQLLAPVEARPEPVVAYRMRNNRAPTVEAQEAGDEVARHLRQREGHARPPVPALRQDWRHPGAGVLGRRPRGA
ncbi:helix-turn-helix transcriptional regulator [Piscinibacter sakaiensis]|uniref:helix-turn-helix domain-containing protein n=1 Tax=Piscinibacter sakaiensis TaxID=1547922 RepID=UPI0009E8E3FD